MTPQARAETHSQQPKCLPCLHIPRLELLVPCKRRELRVTGRYPGRPNSAELPGIFSGEEVSSFTGVSWEGKLVRERVEATERRWPLAGEEVFVD